MVCWWRWEGSSACHSRSSIGTSRSVRKAGSIEHEALPECAELVHDRVAELSPVGLPLDLEVAFKQTANREVRAEWH